MSDHPRRGQIYWVDFNPARGSEQAGRRPAVVVSNDVANQHSPNVIVAALTRTAPSKPYPMLVVLTAGHPLPEAGVVACNQLMTITKDRLDGYRADLSPQQLRAVDRALAVALGLPRL